MQSVTNGRPDLVEFIEGGCSEQIIGKTGLPVYSRGMNSGWSDVNNRTGLSGVQHNSGFALVIVIWLFGIIAVLVLSFMQKVRIESLIAANLASNARMEWIADGMVRKAALDLALSQEAPASGVTRCRWIGGALVEVSLQDQAGLIDLNTAPFSILQLLLRREGADQSLAGAIGDFRDRDTVDAEGAPEPLRYVGRDYGPKNAPFDTVAELQQVPGVDINLFEKLAPFLTVHSFEVGLDAAVAPSGVRDFGAQALSAYQTRSKSFAYEIDVRVEGERNSRFRRKAIAVLHRHAERPYSFVTWQRPGDWDREFVPSLFVNPCF